MIWLGLLLFALLAAFAASYIRAARRGSVAPPPISPEPVEAGAAVILLHHRRAGREEIARDWMLARRNRVGDVAGLRAYLLISQAPRLNIIYQALRFSRSWPFAALNALRHGLPTPPLRQTRAARYDLAELFYFDDLAGAEGFLDGEAAALAEAAAPHAAPAGAVLMRATRAMPNVEVAGRVATLFLLRAHGAIGRPGMIDYWLNRHRPFVLGQQPLLGFSSYDQLVAPGKAGDWDGVALLVHPDFPDLMRGLIDPRIQMANFGLVHDEARFLDFAQSSLMLGTVEARWRAVEETA